LTLAAIASLLPRGGDGPLAVIGAYVEALANELAEARLLSHEAFAAFVTAHRSAGLDAAREAAVTMLETPGIVAGD
jgi:hypothetical protein